MRGVVRDGVVLPHSGSGRPACPVGDIPKVDILRFLENNRTEKKIDYLIFEKSLN